MHSLFVLEVLHGGRIGLYNNKVHARAYLITLGIKDVACHVVTDVVFQHGIHAYLVDTGQKLNRLVYRSDKRLSIEVS